MPDIPKKEVKVDKQHQQKVDKSVYEELWERENPMAAKKVEEENLLKDKKKLEKTKEEKEKSDD